MATPAEPEYATAESVAHVQGGYLSLHRTAVAPYQPVGDALVLRRYRQDGALLWERRHEVTESRPGQAAYGLGAWGALAAAPDGTGYLSVSVTGRLDLGRVRLENGHFLARLDADGRAAWAVPFPEHAQPQPRALAVGADGSALAAAAISPPPGPDGCATVTGGIFEVHPGGIRTRFTPLHPPRCGGEAWLPRALAANRGGEVAVGGVVTASQSPFVALLSAERHVAWRQELEGTLGRVVGAAFGPAGPYFLGVHHALGPLRWGEASLWPHPARDRGFLLAAGVDGAPRWALALGAIPSEGALTAGPDAVYVGAYGAASPEDPVEALFVARFTAAGERSWSAAAQRGGGPDDNFSEGVASAVASAEGVVLFGQFSWTEDFGAGPVTPQNTDLFLWRLAP